MSVTEVSIDGLGNAFDANGQVLTINGSNTPLPVMQQGSGVEIAPGLYLTAAHVFFGPQENPKNKNIYTFSPGTMFINATAINNSQAYPLTRSVTSSNSISNLTTDYKPNKETTLPQGNDIASFTANSVGPSTGVVLFMQPTLANFQKYFASVTFTGYPSIPTGDPSSPSSPQPTDFTPSAIEAINQVPGTFSINGASIGGESGAGVYGTATGSSTTYVLGTVEAGNPVTDTTLVNYLTPSFYYNTFSNYTPPSNANSGNSTRNLIIGSGTGNDQIKGTSEPQNVVDSGNNNKILAGTNGDLINAGPGLNNEVFIPSDDAGATVVVSPGSETIVGGGPNDKLVLLADRLWNSTTGAPTASSVSDSSPTIQLLGGYDSYGPDDIYGPTGAPSDFDFSTDPVYGAPSSDGPGLAGYELGQYDYQADYQLQSNGDLVITVDSQIPSTTSINLTEPWTSTILIKNYQPGDFGLTLTVPTVDYNDYPPDIGMTYTQVYDAETALTLSEMAPVVAQNYVDDDASQQWNLGSGGPAFPAPTPTSTALANDLSGLQNLYGNPYGNLIAQQQDVGESPVQVFANAEYTDTNANASDTLNIQFTGGGTLSDGSGFDGLTSSGPDQYTVTGTASEITAEVDAIIFVPASGTPYAVTSTTFTLTYTSSSGTARPVSVTVDDAALPVAPVIGGDFTVTAASAGGSSNPFGTLAISDPNANSTETLTITVGGTGGTLVDGTGYDSLVASSTSGIFTLSGAASAVTAELDALVFSPASGTTSTSPLTFQVTDTTIATTNATVAAIFGQGGVIQGDAENVVVESGAIGTDTGNGNVIALSDNAQVNVSGENNTVNFVSSSGSQVILSGTAGMADTINGSDGSIYLSSAQTSIYGSNNSIDFYAGTGNIASLYGTDGSWDSISGADGQVNLNDAQTSVDGTGNTIVFSTGMTNQVTLTDTNGTADTINGDGGTIYLESSQASVTGSSDTVQFYSGTGNVATLSGTNGNWDSVSGTGGEVDMNGAESGVDGAGNTINFLSGTTNQVDLTDTNGTADTINGSGGTIFLESSQASVAGGGNGVQFFSGTGNVATLSGTNGNWDSVSGTGGEVDMNGAESGVDGAGNTINFLSGTTNQVTLTDTNGTADTINGDGGTIYLESSQASVTGSSDTVQFYSGTGNVATLSGTNGNWDSVSGTGGEVDMNGAESGVDGAGNTINFLSGTTNQVTLTDTNGTADTINGDGGTIYLESSQASISGKNNSIQFYSGTGNVAGLSGMNNSVSYSGSNGGELDINGTSSVSISDLGNALQINVGSAIQTDVISGFGSSDTTGVIDLKNGVGGYASVNDVVAALHSDGKGGTVLALGTTGSIDFVGTAPSQLHASNFAVG